MLDRYSHELEHRTRLLMAASEIARTATGILDRDSLGQLAVDHIAAEFGSTMPGSSWWMSKATGQCCMRAPASREADARRAPCP